MRFEGVAHSPCAVCTRGRHAPSRRRGRDGHLPAGGADATQRISWSASPCSRRHAVGRTCLVEAGLFDGHSGPVDVELLGDEHRQRRLDALADLRVLGHDGDAAVRSDRDEGPRHEGRARRTRRLRLPGREQVLGVPGEHHAPPATAEARRNSGG
jgi:hypothetical protein